MTDDEKWQLGIALARDKYKGDETLEYAIAIINGLVPPDAESAKRAIEHLIKVSEEVLAEVITTKALSAGEPK